MESRAGILRNSDLSQRARNTPQKFKTLLAKIYTKANHQITPLLPPSSVRLCFLDRNWHMQHQRRQPGFISLSFHSLPARARCQESGRESPKVRQWQTEGNGAMELPCSRLWHIHFKQKPISRGPQHAATVCASDACVVPLNTFGC